MHELDDEIGQGDCKKILRNIVVFIHQISQVIIGIIVYFDFIFPVAFLSVRKTTIVIFIAAHLFGSKVTIRCIAIIFIIGTSVDCNLIENNYSKA